MTEQEKVFTGEEQVFKLFPAPHQRRFATLRALSDYVNSEIAYWDNVDDEIKSGYASVLTDITTMTGLPSDSELVPKTIETIKNKLRNFSYFGSPDIRCCVSSETMLGQYLQTLRAQFGNNYNGYRNERWYILRGIYENTHAHMTQFTPYAFENMVKGVILKWSDFLLGKQAIASQESLFGKLQSRLAGQDAAIDQQRTAFDEILESSNKQILNQADRFEVQFNEQEQKYKTQFATIHSEAEDLKAAYKARITDLENVYTKKLELEAPAQYWMKMATVNFWKGIVYGILDIIAIVALALMAYTLLANGDVLPIFNASLEGFNLGLLRASLMLLVFTSAWAYVIHVLTRLAISSLHLARDYNERFQLTRVYLALLKDDALKDDQNLRQIVMQSIFCRSDTGLLKTEGGIKMPAIGDIIGKGD